MIMNSVIGRLRQLTDRVRHTPTVAARGSQGCLDLPGGCIQSLEPRVAAYTCSHYFIVTSRLRMGAGASVM